MLIFQTLKKKKKTNNTKAKRDAAEAFDALKERHKNATKLGDKYGPTKKKGKALTEIERHKLLVKERLVEARSIKSLSTAENSTGKPLAQTYADEKMQEREKKARSRKFVVAPIANKMGYGLITDAEHLKTMGRKT